MKTKFNNRIRRFFALVLTLTMALSLNTTSVFAAEADRTAEGNEVSVTAVDANVVQTSGVWKGNWYRASFEAPQNASYTVIVAVQGIDYEGTAAATSVTLKILSTESNGNMLNVSLPVDGTAKTFHVSSKWGGRYAVQFLSSGAYAYSITIY